MKLSRKDFLRLAAGAVALAGAGGLVHAVNGPDATPRLRSGQDRKRWGMVIDLQKCREEKGCDRCAMACHATHNVPSIPDKAHEVKWIWNERGADVFPFQPSEYTSQSADAPLPVLCNHCTDPACVRVCPTRATWKR